METPRIGLIVRLCIQTDFGVFELPAEVVMLDGPIVVLRVFCEPGAGSEWVVNAPFDPHGAAGTWHYAV